MCATLNHALVPINYFAIYCYENHITVKSLLNKPKYLNCRGGLKQEIFHRYILIFREVGR